MLLCGATRRRLHDDLDASKDVVVEETFILANAMRTAVVREVVSVVEVVLPNETGVAIRDPGREVCN